MSKPILKRSEVAEKDTWNLGDIFASDELWRSEYENLKAAPKASSSTGADSAKAPGCCSATSACATRSPSASASCTATQAARATRTPATASIRICAARR